MKANMWKKFLISDIAGKVIGTFKEVFLGIYFLKITKGSVVDVSLYYIIFYMSYILCLLMVNHLKKLNLIAMYRAGLFLTLMQCVLLLVLGAKITDYIILFALFSSVGNAFYYYPEQILIKRVNTDDNFQNYITKDQIIKYIISITFPIILGYCISKNSYNLAFIVLILMISICFFFSLLIKDLYLEHGNINLKRFFNNISKNGNKKLMKLLSFRTLFRGLSSFGVLSTLITIITFLVVTTELSLGSISSFITIISILVVCFMNKYSKKQKLYKIFIPLSVIQCIMVILLTYGMIYLDINKTLYIGQISISLGFILVLLYNIINGVSNPIFETSNSIAYYECMSKQKISVDDEPNYVFWFELIINISRSLGYLILIFISIVGFNINIIATMIAGFTFMYIAYAYTLKKIFKEYII